MYAFAVPPLLAVLRSVCVSIWQGAGAGSPFILQPTRLLGIATILLPPALLMGATLPVLAHQIVDNPARYGRTVGGIYALNTLGAVLGCGVAGFVGLRVLGVLRTSWCVGILNLCLAAAACLAATRFPPREMESGAGVRNQAPASVGSRSIRFGLLVFALSGFSAMALEVAWTRIFALVVGNSIYALTVMLLAFLFRPRQRRRSDLRPPRPVSPAGSWHHAGVSSRIRRRHTYATALLFPILPRLFAEVHFSVAPGPVGWLAVEFLLALAIMFPATFALGGTFPAILHQHGRGGRAPARSAGDSFSSNAAGGIAGALAGGFILVPGLGPCGTVLAAAALEMALGLVVATTVAARGRRARVGLVGAVALIASMFLLVRPGWDPRLMNSGIYVEIQRLPAGSTWPILSGGSKASAWSSSRRGSWPRFWLRTGPIETTDT